MNSTQVPSLSMMFESTISKAFAYAYDCAFTHRFRHRRTIVLQWGTNNVWIYTIFSGMDAHFYPFANSHRRSLLSVQMPLVTTYSSLFSTSITNTPNFTPQQPLQTRAFSAVMHSPRDHKIVLNRSTVDHSIVLRTNAFIGCHLAIGRLTETDCSDLIAHVIFELKQSKVFRNGRWVKTRMDTIHDICLEWDKGKGKLGEATARMKYDSSRVLCCDYLDKSSIKTNAQFVLVDSSANAGSDLTSVGRCRKFHTLRAETEIDIVAAASLIIETDPCRRFMNAFTIEGMTMTLWHFSRSHIAISERFDYHKTPEPFIRFVIFMTFASRAELGYDPTVTRVQDANGRTQYQFRIGDKVYQTLRTLAELQQMDIICKAPRVWAVTELHAETKAPIGEALVLKDFWAYADVKGELEIQTGIFNALRKVDEDGDGPANTSGLLAEEAKKFFLHIVGDAAYAAAYGVSGMPQPPSTPRHTTKVHQRIIFAEECEPMDEISKYGDFALAMAQLIQGLDYMRIAGYTHHDISLGNCLVHGTPGFMAVEYESGRHLFVPTIVRSKMFFRYNFAHDLEAALWIYIWFIFNKIPDCLDPDASADCRSEIQYCRDELLEEEDSSARLALVTKDVASHAAFQDISQLYNGVPEGASLSRKTAPLDVGVAGMTRWDPKSFSPAHYIFLRDQFMDMHDRLAGVGYSAVTHREFELAAAEVAAQRVEKREHDDGEDEVEEKEVDSNTLKEVAVQRVQKRERDDGEDEVDEKEVVSHAQRVQKRERDDGEDDDEDDEKEVGAKKLCVRADEGETDVESPATGAKTD
ncbi:hypothetical protein CPB85DRAFT_1444032 [Mucidula mucida]|nr:hypothetical protein CPB85DRAFT_1444032 [Mucidula mucida]